MKATILVSILMLSMLGCNDDSNNNNDNGNLSDQDKQFMAFAKEANVAEIDAGNLASNKGNNQAVKNFGQWMVAEHTTAKTSLDSLAGAVNVTLADTMNAEHDALKQTLNNLNGYAFDTTYIGAQVRDHMKVIQQFQNEIQNGRHSEVKNYANRFLPHIQMHLTTADSIKGIL